MALLAVAAGCQLNLSGIPTRAVDPGASLDSGPRPGVDAGAPDAGRSVADAGSRADAAVPEDAGSVVEPVLPIRHAECEQALPDSLPSLPYVADATGRPSFDTFRDFSCDSVQTYPTCEEYDGDSLWTCDGCWGAKGEPDRVCTEYSTSSDHYLCIEAFSRDSSCANCIRPEAKARACCLGIDMDCRSWPFAEPSQRGQQCARHEDCEAGLLCVGINLDHGGATVCECPGFVQATSLPDCVQFRLAQ